MCIMIFRFIPLHYLMSIVIASQGCFAIQALRTIALIDLSESHIVWTEVLHRIRT